MAADLYDAILIHALLIVGGSIIGVIVICLSWKHISHIWKSKDAIEVMAQVIDKSFFGRTHHRSIVDIYRVTFEFPDCTTQTFEVSANIYESLQIGMNGRLKYNGKSFISFT